MYTNADKRVEACILAACAAKGVTGAEAQQAVTQHLQSGLTLLQQKVSERLAEAQVEDPEAPNRLLVVKALPLALGDLDAWAATL